MSLRKLFRLLSLGVVLLMATGLWAALPERKTFQFGDFTIEASAGDEAYVEALALRLADFKLLPPPAPPALKLSLADLAKRRDFFLGKVAGYLGLEKPTENMAADFDATLINLRAMRPGQPVELPRRFALWRRPELLARSKAGETIPGLRTDASGGLDYEMVIREEPEPEDGKIQGHEASSRMTWREVAWPIKIAGVEGKTPDEEAAEALIQLSDFHQARVKADQAESLRSQVFDVLRETVESGIVSRYLAGRDRRWFCAGVANFVAFKIVEGELGAAAARGYYDLKAELNKFAEFAPRIDLAAWPAAEDMEKANYPADLNTANQAFATKAIADVCARHGDDLLPMLFREIGRTRLDKASMKTVYKAFKKLTGEDLRAVLPKPGSGQ